MPTVTIDEPWRPGRRRPQTVPNEPLVGPLELIRLSLISTDTARAQFADYRLTRLVGARLELDESDIERLSDMLGTDLLFLPESALRPFDHHLRRVIDLYNLRTLFCDDGHGLYHHAIRPTGYDFHHDEVIPIGMAQWRADYRAMSEVRQMLAASIIWLYRAGKDNVWLRRVPCTWHAADAIAALNNANAFGDWARLYALYPGW